MSNPIVIVATIVAHPGHEALVQAELQKMLAPSRAEPGCARYELHVDNANPARFVMLEEWRDADAIAIHDATPHFQGLVAAIGGKAEVDIAKLTKIG